MSRTEPYRQLSNFMISNRRHELKHTRLVMACTAAIAMSLTLGLSTAFAQSSIETDTSNAQTTESSVVNDSDGSRQSPIELGAVTVSASRILRAGFVAPTPTVTINATDLDASASVNVAQVLYRAPAIRPSLSPGSTVNNSSHGTGSYLDLRGMGTIRTLVLVDGHRLLPGFVDVNAIPQILINNIDIVTGGASAAWGSDAVAGVINFGLNHNLEGLKGSIFGGQSMYGDEVNNTINLAYGHAFSNKRGHITFAVESYHNSGIPHLTTRPWGAALWGTIPNPAYTPSNDEPQRLLVRNQRSSIMSLGGLINSGPLKGIQFDANGDPIPFHYGALLSPTAMVGGDGANVQQTDQALEPPVTRKNLYGRASWNFTPSLSGHIEALWAKTTAIVPSLAGQDKTTIIHRDNAFLPPSIGTAMDNLGLTSFQIGRYDNDYAQGINHNSQRITRLSTGLDGLFGDSWSWSAYLGHSKSIIHVNTHHRRLTQNYAYAVDAVIDPLTGAAVCRDTSAVGCVPIDIFGRGAPSAKARDYVLGVNRGYNEQTLDEFSFLIRGEPFSLPAGPVSLATGANWRREKAMSTSNLPSQLGLFDNGNSTPWSGKRNVKEAFAEMVLPLVSDTSFAQSINLDVAGRWTDYSVSGAVNTWKVGANWQVNDWLRFRGTRSRDIRAPSLSELFRAGGETRFTIFDPELNANYTVHSISRGSDTLTPEIGKTTTFGFVLSPTSGLRFSVDYWKIDLNKAIVAFQAADIINGCYTNQPTFCTAIVRGPDGMIDHVNSTSFNLQTIRLRGIDYAFSDQIRMGTGNLSLHMVISNLKTFNLQIGDNITKLAGASNQPSIMSIGGQPHWKGNLTAIYNFGRASVNAAAHYMAAANINNSFTSKDRNILRNRSQTFFDIGGSYRVYDGTNSNITVFAAVHNITNTPPPITGAGGYITTRSLYEFIGRAYKLGVRFHF